MLCWICKLNEGTTGDHDPKMSDLKAIYGSASPKQPLYYNSIHVKNAPVNSLNAKRLKSRALICPNCNTSRTAPHDKAWEQLSTFIRQRRQIAVGQVIKLHQAFPQNRQRQMLNVHLYFCKIFGAKVIEAGSPFSADSFADAIMTNTPNRHFYLKIMPDNLVGGSNLDLCRRAHDGLVALAAYRYAVAPFSIACIYALPVRDCPPLRGAWHPSQKAIKIQVTSPFSLRGPPVLYSSFIVPSRSL